MNLFLIGCVGFAFTMIANSNVLVFSGRTRTESVNKKLAQEAATVARELGARVSVIDLKDYPIPFYDGDLEANEGMPENAKKLRNLMINSQAIIIVSPEYNGTLSAVLKNTIDWASRSEEGGSSRAAFAGKKFAIMSASPGKGGGARGLTHLRTIIENIGGKVVGKQVALPNAYEPKAFENSSLKEILREEIGQILQP